jgi:hypothetical protein
VWGLEVYQIGIIMFLKMQIQKKKREIRVLHVAKMLGFLGEKPAEAKIHADFST